MAGFQHKSVGTGLTQAEYEQTDTGHQFASQATGMMLYASSSTVNTSLAIGATNAVLQVVGGVPAWTAAPTLNGSLTVGVNDTGYDVTFFGATSGQYLLWDQSEDELVLAGDTKLSFHDAAGGENIIASADGHLEVNSGTTLDVTAPTVDINASTAFTVDTAGISLDSSGASNLTTSGGALTITAAAASTWSSAAGALTITSAAAATWSTAAGALTITAGAALNLNPTSGSAILLDGTISIDAGVVTGATAITSATIDATTDFTVGDTVITDGVVTDTTGLSIVANTDVTGTLGVGGVELSHRNSIINGAMQVAQRSTSTAGLGAADGYFTLDRWNIDTGAASAGRFTMAQVADGPSGYANCLKITATTADTSIAAGELLVLQQKLEGQDVQHFKKGESDATSITVSFWVKADAAVVYTCELQDHDNTRHSSQAFTTSTSWAQHKLTFAGDTSDALDDDNAVSLSLNFILHGGTTYSGGTFASNTWADTTANTRMAESHGSIFASTSRTFFLTGVQVEAGAIATEFEHKTYAEELVACQRYLSQIGGPAVTAGNKFGNGWALSTTTILMNFPTSVDMRAAPSVVISAVDAWDSAAIFTISSAGNPYNTGSGLLFEATVSGATAYRPAAIRASADNGYIQFDAEL